MERRGRPGAITRRALMAGLATLLAACRTAASAGTNRQLLPLLPRSFDGNAPFDVWTELRAALRSSPDNLPAAAERVVAGRDPAAIFAFVRDQIATYPALPSQFPLTSVRWGIRGALRGGAGTPRERAELLADLYRRAGFDAQVVAGVLSVDAAAQRRIFFRRIGRTFAAGVDDATIARWRLSAGLTGGPPRLTPVDPGQADSGAIAQALLAALPSGLTPTGGDAIRLDPAGLGSVPLVQVTIDGQPTYANPLLPDARLGLSYTGPTSPAPAADPALPVSVGLAVSTNEAPSRRVTVVQGSWRADDLVGRQLRAQFKPTHDFDVLMRLKVRDVRTFKPILAVSGPDVDAATAERLAFGGTVVSTGGDTIEVKPDNSVAVNGQTVASPTTNDPAACAPVVSLSLEVQSGTYPSIGLRVAALDAAGRPVQGLTSAAFRLKEGGAPLPFVMATNQLLPPRVLVVLDLSASIPPDFASPDGRANLVGSLVSRVLASAPSATFQLMAVSGGTLPSASGYTLHDAAAAAAASRALSSFGSEIWTALQYANGASPTAIVLVSDGQAEEQSVDGFRAIVAAGAPVVAIGVGQVAAATMADIAAISGGTSVAATQVDAAAAAIGQFVGRQQSQPYQLSYRAPTDGAPTRTVALATPQGVTGSASYAVPAATAAAQPPSLAGLYLTVQVGNEPAVTRVLAGYAGESTPPPGALTPAAALDQVRGALFGSYVVSFEGAAPALSTWLDDLLATKLGGRAAWDAAASGDRDGLFAAFKAGVPSLSGRLPLLQAPLAGAADESSLTYETGLRVVLYAEQPRFGAPGLRRSDVLPPTRWATLADSATASFQATLARSAQVAVAESAALASGTAALLKGKALKAFPPGFVSDADLAFVADPTRRASFLQLLNGYTAYHRLIPAAGDPVAGWVVDPRSGSLLGILADGSGGAAEQMQCQLDDTQSLAALYGLLGGLAGFELGVWVAYSKIIAAQVIRASIMIATMDSDVGPVDIGSESSLRTLGCDLAKEGIGGLIPEGFGKAIFDAASKVDNVLDIFHHDVPCPSSPADSPKSC